MILAGVLGLVSCDSGGDSNSQNANQTVTPPNNLTNASTNNTTNPTNSGANAALIATYQAELFAKINAERTSASLVALIDDPRLTALGDNHNLYMAQQAQASGSSAIQINHDNFQDRANTAFTYGYNFVGENVGALRGFPQSQVTDTLVTGWNNSPGHRANIVGDFTHTGISVYIDPTDNTIYATQIFARLP